MAAEETKTEKPTRVGMPEQEPEVRKRNFDEVPLGYTPEMAREEAARCLQCRNPNCVKGCPVEVDIPAFIGLIRDGDFNGAIRKIWEKNSLPAVCGRVCPQEIQCEGLCVVGRKGVRPGRGRQPGAVRRRRRAGRRGGGVARGGAAHGQAGGGGGLGSLRAHGGGRPGPQGPPGHRVRGVPQAGRCARVRDPRVPAPQGDRLPRGGAPGEAGGGRALQQRHREFDDGGRTAGRRLRRGVRGRGCRPARSSWTCRGRTWWGSCRPTSTSPG